MNITKPSKEDLAAVAMGKPLVEWAKGYLAALPVLLTKNPGFYRAFGPNWWLIKKALVESGNFDFGDQTDAEWIEALEYGATELNLLAAYCYYEDRESMGGLYEQQHILADTDGETVDYYLEDPDMESMYAAQQMAGRTA